MQDGWLVSPAIELPQELAYLSFWSLNESVQDYGKNYVLISKGSGNPLSGDFVEVWSPDSVKETWEETLVFLDDFKGETIYIAFRYTGNFAHMWNLDDVLVEIVPSCFPPKELSVSGLSSSSVTIDWLAMNNESQWELVIGEEGFNPDTATPIIVTDGNKPYHLNDLNPNTSYEVYVRAVCSIDDKSNWSTPLSFTTNCFPIGLPFVEDFEGDAFPPECWRVYVQGEVWDYWELNNYYNHTPGGNQCAYHEDLYNQESWLVSPSIQLPEEAVAFLSYWSLFDEPMFSFKHEILISKGSSLPADGDYEVVYKHHPETTSWEETILYLHDYKGDIINIAFKFNSDEHFASGWYLDDILVDLVSDCPFPFDLVAYETGINDTYIDWSTIGSENSWELVYGERGFDPNGAVPILLGLADKPFYLDNLIQGTQYEVYMRTVCNPSGTSNWSAPLRFTTLCAPFEIPFFEDFEGLETLNLNCPPCWNNVNELFGVPSWEISPIYNHSPGGGQSVFHFNYDFYQDAWLVSPPIQMPENELVELSFWSNTELSYLDYNTNSVLVSKGSNKPSDGDFEVVWQPEGWTDYGWVKTTVYLPDYKGEQIYIAFRYAGEDANVWILDDISLDYAPSCVPPQNLSVSEITSGSALIDWRPLTNETSWEMVVGEWIFDPNEEPSIIINESEKPYLLEGLSGDTFYEVYIRAICGADVYSDWAGPLFFQTLCAIESLPFVEHFEGGFPPKCWDTYSESDFGDNWRRIYGYNMSPNGYSCASHEYGDLGDGWLITPQIELPTNHSSFLSFWTFSEFIENYGRNYVLVSRGSSNPEDNDFEIIWSPDSVTEEWEEIILSLDDYLGEIITIAFRYSGNNAHSWYIDEVVVDYVPSCYTPQNLEVSDITAYTAQIDWLAVNEENKWELAYGFPDFNINNATYITVTESEKPFILKNLLPGETYEVYVRAVCSEDDRSRWTEPIIFSVLCDLTYLPFFDDFEDPYAALNCWEVFDSESYGFSWFHQMYSYNHSPGGEGSVACFSGFNMEGWLVSPEIHLSNHEPNTLSFWSYNLQPTKYGKNSVHISIGSKDPLDGDYVEIWSPASVSASWVETILDLDAYKGENIYIAFKYSGHLAHSWILDDVLVSGNPSYGNLIGNVKVGNEILEGARVFTNEFEVFSNQYGNYALLDLPEGQYDISCEADGFPTKTFENFEIVGGQLKILDFILGAGQIHVNPDAIVKTMSANKLETEVITIKNLDLTANLEWYAEIEFAAMEMAVQYSIPKGNEWLSLGKDNGIIDGGEDEEVDVFINTQGLEDGVYEADIVIRKADNPSREEVRVAVILTVETPFVAGTITGSQTICHNSIPAPLQATPPTGGSQPYNYQWQKNVGQEWLDIDGANDLSYLADALSETTSYRLAQTSSGTNLTVFTNVVTITVYAEFDAGAIAGGGETIYFGESPSTIANSRAASGGNGTIIYSWRSSADGFTNEIEAADMITFTPPATLETSTTFRRYAKDTKCQTTPLQSEGEWTVNVLPVIATYTITANVNPLNAGQINGLLSEYEAGEMVSLTAVANSGYVFTHWTAIGLSLEDNTSSSISFGMPENDVELTAYFSSTDNELSGAIRYFNSDDSPIPDEAAIKIALYKNDALIAGPISPNQGNFAFTEGIVAGELYTIRLWEDAVVGESWSWNNFKAVNATDALIIQFMNIQHPALLNFPWIAPISPAEQTDYARTLADLNSDANIGSVDALLAVQRFVGLIDRFPGNTPNFRLFGSGLNYPHAPEIVFSEHGTYTESTAAGDFYYKADILCSSGNTQFNIYYVASGDLNSSYELNPGEKTQKPVDYAFVKKASIAKRIEIPLRINKLNDLGAFSMDLSYDNSIIEVVSVENVLAGVSSINLDAAQGNIQLAWFNMEGVNLEEQDVFLTLHAHLLKPVSMCTDYLVLDGSSEFVDTDARPLEARITSPILDSKHDESQANALLELKAYPNPFTNESTLVYNLPESGKVQLVILNMLGQEAVRLVEEAQEAGRYSVQLHGDKLINSGTYFYRLQFEGATRTQSLNGRLIHLQK